MKAFLAIILSATVVAAMPSGWGAPSVPTVELDLAANVALTGQGGAGGQQSLSEIVSGNADVPASVVSISGVGASLSQGGDIVQVADADLSGSSPVTSTVQVVSGYNGAAANDVLVADLVGANSILVNNEASTYANGTGTLDSAASSGNVVYSKN